MANKGGRVVPRILVRFRLDVHVYTAPLSRSIENTKEIRGSMKPREVTSLTSGGLQR